MVPPNDETVNSGDQAADDDAGEGRVADLRRSHEALQELYLVTAEPGLDETERIKRMLDIGRRRLDVSNAYLSIIDPETDDYDVELAVGPGVIESGQSFRFSTTYCRETVESDEPQLIPDLDNSVWDGTPAHETHGLSCYVGGRVTVDGVLYGTVCFSGDEPRESFTEDERTLVKLLVEWIGDRLEERHLRETVEQQRRAIEAADSAIAITDADVDGKRPLTYVNRGFEKLTGYDRDAVLGRDCRFLQGPETDPERTAELARTLDAGDHVQMVLRNYRADGTPFWNELEVTPVHEDGEVVRYIGTQRDVTERVERQETVTALLERTRSLLAAGTRDEVATAAARAVEEVLGYDCLIRLYDEETEQLVPVAGTGTEPTAVEPVAVGQSLSGQAYERGTTLGFDRELFEPGGYGHQADATDGLVIPLGEHGTLGLETEGARTGNFERRIAEILSESVQAALEQASQRDRLRLYETVIEQGSEMAAVVGGDLRVELVSDSLARYLGVDPDDIVGREIDELLPAADLAEMVATTENAAPSEPGRFETTVTVDGESRPVELEVSLGEDGDPPFVAVVRDISELAETRGALSRERDRFTSLFTHIPDPVNEVRFEDGEPIICRCNEPFADAFGGGRPPEALVGLPANDLVLDDEDETGRRIDEQVREGRPVTEEIRRRTADGPREFLFRAVPYETPEGLRAFATYTDVTEQQRRQRRIEVLNRVLRHNVRNQISIANGNANLLDERVDDPDLAPIIDGLVSSTENVLSMSEKAREAARALAHDRTTGTSPDTVVGNVVEEFRSDWPDETITLDTTSEPAPVAGPDRLQPVVSNLVENALEHNAPGVRVRVGLDVVGDRLELRIADDGPGIPELERSLIAGDQEITQLHHGNGIGLWAVRWILDAMGGEVRFEDEDGWHAVVISVPLADDA
jgi:PAS domain S-box-containing protein